MEREWTPERTVEAGIQPHPAGLSPSNTKRYPERLGVEWGRTVPHNRVWEAGLQPAGDGAPNQTAVDETVIRLTDERRWLYATVGPRTNEFRHMTFQTRTRQFTVLFVLSATKNSRPGTRLSSSVTHPISPLCWVWGSGPGRETHADRNGILIHQGDGLPTYSPLKPSQRR